MNILSYILNAVNLFNSDQRRSRRIDVHALATSGWAWARRNPVLATIAATLLALLILFAMLWW